MKSPFTVRRKEKIESNDQGEVEESVESEKEKSESADNDYVEEAFLEKNESEKSLLEHYIFLLNGVCEKAESDGKYYGIKTVPVKLLVESKSTKLTFEEFVRYSEVLGILEMSSKNITAVRRFKGKHKRLLFFDQSKCECLFFMKNGCYANL